MRIAPVSAVVVSGERTANLKALNLEGMASCSHGQTSKLEAGARQLSVKASHSVVETCWSVSFAGASFEAFSLRLQWSEVM